MVEISPAMLESYYGRKSLGSCSLIPRSGIQRVVGEHIDIDLVSLEAPQCRPAACPDRVYEAPLGSRHDAGNARAVRSISKSQVRGGVFFSRVCNNRARRSPIQNVVFWRIDSAATWIEDEHGLSSVV
jgi:hypothetical protein